MTKLLFACLLSGAAASGAPDALAAMVAPVAAAPSPPTTDTLPGMRVDTVDIRMTDGATVTAIIARPGPGAAPLPAILRFTIYARDRNLTNALEGAAHGYVGIVTTSRGKRRSAGPVVPYEHDGADVYDVIDWISRQPWSDGRVGMFGGSYDGFTSWASTKRLHPALRTIVPSAAAAPGLDVPMENNVFQTFPYSWIPYVTNNNLLDSVTYGDRHRWWRQDSTWFMQGRAYRDLDAVDGTPSPIFRRWLDHPSYDAYWQRMIPYGDDFAHIDIPVLTTTGYFDGGQIGAMYYFREHYRHNPRARHYLLIGPFDHFGSQGMPGATVGTYAVDSVARIDITAIIYQWFDHVLKQGPLPAILQDRVNYEVMGANRWRHVPSLSRMSNDTMTLYLSGARSGDHLALASRPVPATESIRQDVDLVERGPVTNVYLNPSADSTIDAGNGLTFVSEPLHSAVEISGSFTGALVATINKKDLDVGVTLYELTEKGEYVQLSYFLGRASYARDKSRRHLLTPGARERIPFTNTRITSRRIAAGSRLVVVVAVPFGPNIQINYGTGKDVSDETIADGTEPLRIQWHGGSFVKIPIMK